MESKLAFNEFLEMLKEADQTFLDPEANLDEQGKVDGYRHFFHLMHAAVDFYLFNDPLKPRFMPLTNSGRKLFGDNVDAVYYFTQLRGDQEYVIKGRRFDSCYLSFCIYGGDPHGELADRVTLNINHRDIQFGKDGSFEIRLTPDPGPGNPNEFKLEPDSVNMFTREYFFDRPNSTESELSITNTNPQPPGMPLTDEQLARHIRTMAMFFQCTTWIAPLPVELPVNEFLPAFEFDPEQGGWGTPDNIYCFARFRVEEDEYLNIKIRSPDCCYWGIQTWNFLMQSTNYADFPVCVNNATAIPAEDGSVEVVLSHREAPRNWMSTAGYREGVLFCRWLLADELPEPPGITVLKW